MTAGARAGSRTASRRGRSWWPWAAMAVVVVALLGYGTLGRPNPSDSERAQALAAGIRCPSCASQSANTSDTPSSEGVRELIRRRIVAGDSDEEIRDFVDSRYPGQNLLLDPPGRGFGALVWGLPVVGAVIAIAVLVSRFADWRPGTVAVTDADRDLVADAQRGRADRDPNRRPGQLDPLVRPNKHGHFERRGSVSRRPDDRLSAEPLSGDGPADRRGDGTVTGAPG